jgi:hypothetical protein
MLDILFSKNQRTVELLARDILTREVGQRLPTSIEYQELLGVGSGTVQKGLRVLESVGALQLRARGHKGTLLIDQRVGQLWALSGLGHMTGTAPLPDSTEAVGLATGLRSEFDRIGIPLQMLYMHGSSHRIRTVMDQRADFAILSRGAGERGRLDGGPAAWAQLDFGAYSYYGYGSIVVLIRPGLDPSEPSAERVIGIDRDSYDHAQLTFAEFPESPEHRYDTYDYPQIPAAVAEGRIDAAVWHRTALSIPLELVGIHVRPLQRPDALEVCETLDRAVLLARQNRREQAAVLRSLNLAKIRETQEAVMRHEIVPVY